MKPEHVAAGKPVSHSANPGRIGILTGKTLQTMFLMAEVDWGNQYEFVDISNLFLRETASKAEADEDVKLGRYGTIEDFRRRMTFEKLRGLLTDVFYSMKTSEIDFYPHQFKPVLRFIESATNRLLIADEVGLGKTIEAGLIWTEWQARQKARRLMVVCPPTLCPKWVRELQERFQLDPQTGDVRQLLNLLEGFDRMGPNQSFVFVTSYNALRPIGTERVLVDALRKIGDEDEDVFSNNPRLPPRVRLLLRLIEWRQAEPFIDLVVFDEATVMKNTATASYLAGEIFSAAAGASLCLSATPIHNQSRDLYALLRLIDPEIFKDEFVFDQLRQRNLPVVRLQNELAKIKWNIEKIQSLIESLPLQESRNEIAQAVSKFDGSPGQRVLIRHQVERQNLLGSFINRTRKRDIMENRVIRKAVRLPVTPNEQEGKFYRAVLKLVRKSVARSGNAVTSFHLLHPALQMSSCLPVVADQVRKGRWGGLEELDLLADDFESSFDVEPGETASVEGLQQFATYDFEANDSKYAELRNALRLIETTGGLPGADGAPVQIDPKEKLIVFAFFKQTIRYLERRLEADGFKTIAVTGDIKDRDERDRILLGFESDQHRVMLCSEIAAEGIDLQFARVLINYDLPWNPMRVEQRIGRIDRIGQQSPTIVIVNFQVEDTIDGSIFAHLYNKIGIFEHTIGALEGILGEEVAKLTAQVFREELTPQQVAERAEQTADAVLHRAKQEEELEHSTGALVAFNDLLSEQIGQSQRLGRFIKPAELRLHVTDFLANRFSGRDACTVVWDNPENDCVEVTFSFQAFSSFEDFCRMNDYAWPWRFSKESRKAVITFDPLVHQDLKRKYRQLALITHLHPLFRWITKENENLNNDWHKVSAIKLETNDLESGRYFYLIYRMTLEGITRRDAFHYAAKKLPEGPTITGTKIESLLNIALDRGDSAFPRSPADHTNELRELRSALGDELKVAQQTFRQDQSQKLDIRKMQATSHFGRRIAIQKRRIATLEQAPKERQKGLAGFRRQLANLEEEQARQVDKLTAQAASLTESFSEVACGMVEVERENA